MSVSNTEIRLLEFNTTNINFMVLMLNYVYFYANTIFSWFYLYTLLLIIFALIRSIFLDNHFLIHTYKKKRHFKNFSLFIFKQLNTKLAMPPGMYTVKCSQLLANKRKKITTSTEKHQAKATGTQDTKISKGCFTICTWRYDISKRISHLF